MRTSLGSESVHNCDWFTTMYQLLVRWARWLSRGLYFGAYRGAQGYGIPKPRAQWEAEYRSGRWDCLATGRERAAQMVVLGFAIHQHDTPSVLDVGCGDGVLFSMLQRFPLTEYHGVDVSEEAIARLRDRALPQPVGCGVRRVTFSRADFEMFAPPRRYDVIVFNNSLAYAADPLWTLERYASHLARGGFIVVSLCYNELQFAIWKRIAQRFSTVHSAEVTNELGLRWHVRVLQRTSARFA